MVELVGPSDKVAQAKQAILLQIEQTQRENAARPRRGPFAPAALPGAAPSKSAVGSSDTTPTPGTPPAGHPPEGVHTEVAAGQPPAGAAAAHYPPWAYAQPPPGTTWYPAPAAAAAAPMSYYPMHYPAGGLASVPGPHPPAAAPAGALPPTPPGSAYMYQPGPTGEQLPYLQRYGMCTTQP